MTEIIVTKVSELLETVNSSNSRKGKNKNDYIMWSFKQYKIVESWDNQEKRGEPPQIQPWLDLRFQNDNRAEILGPMEVR